MKGAWGIYMKSDIDKAVEAEREACAKTIELIIGVDVGWEDADTIRVAAKAIRKRGNE